MWGSRDSKTELSQLGEASVKKQLKLATARCPVRGTDRAFYSNAEEDGIPGDVGRGGIFRRAER